MFRFRLRSLFIATAVVAVLSASVSVQRFLNRPAIPGAVGKRRVDRGGFFDLSVSNFDEQNDRERNSVNTPTANGNDRAMMKHANPASACKS